MIVTFILAAEVLREALRRRWILALGVAITLFLVLTFGALRLEVVDGALSATRLFGRNVDVNIRSIDIALRPVFKASAYLIFYGGITFGTITCAEFAPKLLSPGRIEHLLSQPVRRSEIIVGTFLGVWALASGAMLYAAVGFAVILSAKTGVSITGPVVAALLSSLAWAAIYSVMLATSAWVRSTALSATVGLGVLIGGVIAGHRSALLQLFAPGLGRAFFSFVSLLLPKISALAEVTGKLAGSEPVPVASVLVLIAGFLVFSLAGLLVAVVCFERKDF